MILNKVNCIRCDRPWSQKSISGRLYCIDCNIFYGRSRIDMEFEDSNIDVISFNINTNTCRVWFSGKYDPQVIQYNSIADFNFDKVLTYLNF
jgi:hypothetical protein